MAGPAFVSFRNSMKISGIIRSIVVVVLSATLAFGGCSIIDDLTGKQERDDLPLLLLAAAVLGVNTGCKNGSGLVICIPPGLRQ